MLCLYKHAVFCTTVIWEWKGLNDNMKNKRCALVHGQSCRLITSTKILFTVKSGNFLQDGELSCVLTTGHLLVTGNLLATGNPSWRLTWCEFHSSKRLDTSFTSILKQSQDKKTAKTVIQIYLLKSPVYKHGWKQRKTILDLTKQLKYKSQHFEF